jgi:hypothetical protein
VYIRGRNIYNAFFISLAIYFDAREDHLPAVVGFIVMSGFDQATMAVFLEARLKGVDRLIQAGELGDEEMSYLLCVISGKATTGQIAWLGAGQIALVRKQKMG